MKIKWSQGVASHEREKAQGGASLPIGRNQVCFLAWKENNPVTEMTVKIKEEEELEQVSSQVCLNTRFDKGIEAEL